MILIRTYAWSLLIGITTGIIAVILSATEIRWIAFALVSLVGLALFLAWPRKEQLLSTIFVLSLQLDVHIRVLFGYAGSGGIATSLVFITGFILLLWFANTGKLIKFKPFGSMGPTIWAVFITTIFSLINTTEQFVGITALWVLLQQYTIYFLALNLANNSNQFTHIVKLLFIMVSIQSIIYFIQSALGFSFDILGEVRNVGEIPRPGGTVSTNPAGFSSFIMPGLIIAVANLVAHKHFLPRRYLYITAAVGTLAIGLTYTRAPWIGYGLAVAFVAAYGFKEQLIRPRMIIAIVSTAAIALTALLPAMLMRINLEYGSANAEATLDERMGLIEIALNIIYHHPILGIGPGSYDFLFREYVPAGIDQWVYVVHNEFLLRAAETGIPGALAFFAFIMMGFRVANSLIHTETSLVRICAIGWLGALIALVWQMNWVPWHGWSYNAMLWFMIGLMDGAQPMIKQSTQTNPM